MHILKSPYDFVVPIGLITLQGMFLRIFMIASQPAAPDDLFVALTGINYMEWGNLGPTMWNHPGLRNILIYFAMKGLGPGILGIKGVSLLAGTLSISLVALVAKRLLRDTTMALTAALLWAVEPLAIDFSRLAINDIYLAFFPLLGIFLCYCYRESGRQWHLVCAGLSFGCGIASKWSGVFPMTVTFLMMALMVWREKSSTKSMAFLSLIHLAATIILLPVLVYLITFMPWFGRGYDFLEWPSLQQSMYRETAQHTGYHPLELDKRDHWAREWFIRPVSYEDIFVTATNDVSLEHEPGISLEKNVTILLAAANPLVWLLVLPAVAFAAYRGIRRRDEGLCGLTAFFVAAYLPLALAGRPIWVDTALSVLPFAFMAVAYLVGSFSLNYKMRNNIVAIYLALVVITTIPLYYMVIGKGFELPPLKKYLTGKYLSNRPHISGSDMIPSAGGDQ